MEITFKPNKIVAYNKIVKVIDSCKTNEHIQGAKNMVYTFSKMFDKTQENKDLSEDLYTQLFVKKMIISS
tara:strand:- start:961 stop:1170 length:210 start_codon:yes stop_codon:yes gene_type:complete